MLTERHLLDGVSFFQILNRDEKERLVDRMETVKYRLGQIVCKSGEPGSAFYIVLSGQARVLGTGPDGKEISLGLLGDGDHFGEDALLGGGTYDFTIRSTANLVLLKLHKTDFLRILDGHPELNKYFQDYMANDAMRKFLKRSTVLAPMNSVELRALLDQMTICRYAPGENIVREGERGDAFYIIATGEADVIKESDEGKILNRLKAGEFFGELSLLTGDPRKATVKAAVNTEVFRLTKSDFDNLIERYPKIRDAIVDVASGYSNEPAALPIKAETEEEERQEGRFDPQWESVPEGSRRLTFLPKRRRWRIPVILQQSETDCGAACLAMISRYYGTRLSITRLRNLANVTRYGATMFSLSETAEALGFETRGLQTDLAGLEKQPLPAIVHWQGIHYVVVYRITDKEVVVADPAIGLQRISRSGFSNSWTGMALTLTPTVKLVEAHEKGSTALGKFLPYFKPHKPVLLDILLLSIMLQLLGLAMPLFTQTIIDQVLVTGRSDLLVVIMIGMIMATLFSLVFTAVRHYMVTYMSQKIDLAMITDFYRHVMSLPLGYFIRRRVGDIITRVNENEKIRRMLTTSTMSALLDILAIFVYVGLMLVYNAKLALAGLLFLPLLAAVALFMTPYMKKNSRKTFQAEVEMQSHMMEAIGAISTVKTLASEKSVRWRLEDHLKKVNVLRMNGSLLGVMAESLASALKSASSFAVLFYGASLVMRGEISVGQLMAFTVILGHVIDPMLRLIHLWDEFQEVRVAIERLNDVYDAEPEEGDPSKTIRLTRMKGHIKFENVTFRYEPDGKNALQNVNLEIFPGQTVALVGRSGAGKSTFANLLLKLFQTSEGKITLDGFDLRQINAIWLRRQIGVVQQENVLFSGTISDNIAGGMPDLTTDRIVAAATLAGAHEFISALPLGYETVIGERGTSLSGGQRQRLAIARALVGEPKLLVFDEATSALDTESERVIQRNMDSILRDRTTIIIAHRLSTVRKADLIVVLDQGIIVETGSHEQLMAARGLYYYLNSQQLEQ